MDVSKDRGTPKSSSLIGFSLINHLFWGTTILGNTQMGTGIFGGTSSPNNLSQGSSKDNGGWGYLVPQAFPPFWASQEPSETQIQWQFQGMKWQNWQKDYSKDTVDGRNPGPVRRYFYPTALQGFSHGRWLAAGFLPSTASLVQSSFLVTLLAFTLRLCFLGSAKWHTDAYCTTKIAKKISMCLCTPLPNNSMPVPECSAHARDCFQEYPGSTTHDCHLQAKFQPSISLGTNSPFMGNHLKKGK